MDVRWISPTAVEEHDAKDIESLLSRSDGFLWVDIPHCDERAASVLTEVFGFHPLGVRECQ